MPGKLNLFLRQMIIDHQEDDPGIRIRKEMVATDSGSGSCWDKSCHSRETESLERTVSAIEDSLCMALKEQGQRTARRANIDRLPEPVQYQHVLVEVRTHTRFNLRQATETGVLCQLTAGGLYH